MWKCDPVVGDFNEDGLLDLAALSRLGTGPRMWLNAGKSGWTASPFGLVAPKHSCGGGLSVADVNLDGHLDLAVADHCHGVSVYLGDGAGRWTIVARELHPPMTGSDDSSDPTSAGAEDVALGDVNSDGFPDLIASASDEGGISLYLSDGTGRKWTWTQTDLPSKGWANRVMLADVNGDGSLDIVAAMGVGPRVWLGDGRGAWRAASAGLPGPVIRGLYHGIDVGDLNEDGRPDIAVANWVDGPEVYLQQSDGSWHKTPDVFPNMRGGAAGLALGDLDGDGHLDIVVSGRLTLDGGFVRGVFALYGDGAGHWSYAADSGLPETGLAFTAGVALADLNMDGRVDVVAAGGLIVETAPGPTEPVIPQRLTVWCGQD